MPSIKPILCFIMACLALAGPVFALETDRQKPLEVNADSTDGVLGDGVMRLSGNVEIRQGSLLIRADSAEVDKADGKVRHIILRGSQASLHQEIEQIGQVNARAQTIEYSVGSGIVLLTGDAQVHHPQYEISGDQLRYDLNLQHFEGNGDENGNGRVHIRLDPEVAPVIPPVVPDPDASGTDSSSGGSDSSAKNSANAAG